VTTPQGLPLRVVLLLAAAVFINYVDRGTLATAAPLLKDELGLTNAQMGILLSAFFWSYAPLQPVAGWLAQRFDVRHVLAGGLALWAIATALSGLASGFAMLLVLRVLLGIGESVAFPCNSQLLAQRAAEHERGRANGLISAGLALGPTIGTFVGGLAMATFGWRATFIVFGLVSLLWLLPWRAATRSGVATAAPVQAVTPVAYRAILRERAAWGMSLGHFCANYSYYFVVSWLPLYFVKVHGFSMAAMASTAATIYALQAACAALGGWASDRWIIAGATATRVRKSQLVISMLGVGAAMMACANAGPRLAIAMLLLVGVFYGLQGANLFATSQTLAGPRAAGKWVGVQNLVANIAGVLAPLVTGLSIDRTGGYWWAFAIAAAVTLLGSLAFGVLVRRVEPVAWPVDAPVPQPPLNRG
jgi:MFS family permease